MADKREIAAELLSRFSYADSWRQQYDQRAVEWYKLYIGYKDPPPKELAGRSNLHIPRTYEQIDTLRARIVKSFLATRPYIDFVAQPQNAADLQVIAENEEKAKLAAAVVDMQLERNVFAKRLYDFVTSVLVFPAGIMAVGWRYERKKVKRKVPIMVGMAGEGLAATAIGWTVQEVEVTEWDDNELVNVDYFDFWPDPRGTDIDTCRFVFQREWLTQESLEMKLELLREAGSGTVWMPDFEELKGAGAGLEEGRWQRFSAVGLTPETGQGYNAEEGGYLFEVLHYWEDERHAIIVNRSELVYDGANPYWRHGKKPFIVASFDPLPNEFYGLSAVQVIEHLQHELNTLRNQRIDNISLVLNKMWKVKRSADIDESELVSRPHGIIYVDTSDDVTELTMTDVTASAYNDETIVKQDMENALGVPAVIRGVTSSKKETATEVVTKASNASIRFDVKIMLFEALGLKRLAYLIDCNNQQFIDTPRLVKLFGVDGPAAWRLIEPSQLIGEWDYRPAGSSVDPAANKEVRRQQLNELIAVLFKTRNPYVDMYELTKMWLEAYDIRNVEKLLISPQEIAQQQAGPVIPGTPPLNLGPGGGQTTPIEPLQGLLRAIGGGQGGP